MSDIEVVVSSAPSGFRLTVDVFFSRRLNIRHILNVAAGLDITRQDHSIVEKKIELLDVPEQDIEQGIVMTYHIMSL